MPEFAVVCPGQGNQSNSMFDIVEADPVASEVLASFSAASGLDLAAVARDGARLHDNAFVQPAMVALACSAWAGLREGLAQPAVWAGYSVGELSAWCCAGAWDVTSAAAIARSRAELMDRHSPPGCAMLAAGGLPLRSLQRHAGTLHLAIINGGDHAVFAGPADQVHEAGQALQSHGAWVARLDVRVPSHTPLLDDAAAALLQRIAARSPRPPAASILRGVDGRRAPPDAAAEALCEAIHRTIRWDSCMQEIVESGVRVVLELGPGRSLAKLFAAAHPQVQVRSVSDFRTLAGARAWLLQRIGE